MSKSNQAKQNQKPKSLLGRILRGLLYLAGAIIFSLLISLLIEWVGLVFIWPEEGSGHSKRVLEQELQYLSLHNTDTAFSFPAPPFEASVLSQQLYFWLITWTGLEAVLVWMISGNFLAEFAKASFNCIQIFFIRLAVTITALPLFFLFAYWGSMEGLIIRDLRRFGGDIEHGMIYHFAKHVAGAVIVFPIIFYLAWPEAVNPAWVFLPFAFLLGMNMLVVTRNFTKYV